MRTLQLRVTVTYDEKGSNPDHLEMCLRDVAQIAASAGLFTAGTNATVENWDSEVVEISVEDSDG